MEIKISLPGRLEAEFVLAPVTLLLGPPKAGKTTLLRLIYNALYLKRENRMPKDLQLIIQTVRRAEEWRLLQATLDKDELEVHCSKEECTATGSLSLNALFIPGEVEGIVKHRLTPPYEPYLSFHQFINLLASGITHKSRCTPGVQAEYKVVSKDQKLYEELGDELVDIVHSSTAVVKLGVLIAAMNRGLLDDYDIILLDDAEAGLHPMAKALMAYLIHRLASCGKYVIATTHDVFFVDMVARPRRISELVGGISVEANTAMYLIKDGRSERYSPLTAYIETYTETIAAIYGVKIIRST